MNSIGPFAANSVAIGDSRDLVMQLPDQSIDVAVTSPPYWGQRTSAGNGVEADPREYLGDLRSFFVLLLPKLKDDGLLWLNLGDAYNTPINWRESDHEYSSLGPDGTGLSPKNSAYTKNRHKRRAYLDRDEPWLKYGNLLALTYRLVIGMSNDGWLFRGEVIWRKKNPMPEGRCRRPHRQHEPIYLLTKSERHRFRVSPRSGPCGSFPMRRSRDSSTAAAFPRNCRAAALKRRTCGPTPLCSTRSAGPEPRVLRPSSWVPGTSASRSTRSRQRPARRGLTLFPKRSRGPAWPDQADWWSAGESNPD